MGGCCCSNAKLRRAAFNAVSASGIGYEAVDKKDLEIKIIKGGLSAEAMFLVKDLRNRVAPVVVRIDAGERSVTTCLAHAAGELGVGPKVYHQERLSRPEKTLMVMEFLPGGNTSASFFDDPSHCNQFGSLLGRFHTISVEAIGLSSERLEELSCCEQDNQAKRVPVALVAEMLGMQEADITSDVIDVLGGQADIQGFFTDFNVILRNAKLQGAAKRLAQAASVFKHDVLQKSVVTHGDIHCRNYMLRTPDDLVAIDFELGIRAPPHVDLRWALAQPPRFDDMWAEVDFLAIPTLSEAGRMAFALGYLTGTGLHDGTPDEAICEALLFDIELTQALSLLWSLFRKAASATDLQDGEVSRLEILIDAVVSLIKQAREDASARRSMISSGLSTNALKVLKLNARK